MHDIIIIIIDDRSWKASSLAKTEYGKLYLGSSCPSALCLCLCLSLWTLSSYLSSADDTSIHSSHSCITDLSLSLQENVNSLLESVDWTAGNMILLQSM